MPGQYRLPRRERLTRRKEFVHLYEHGAKWVGAAFVCYMVRADGQGNKIGCVVSRKVGGAVARNRVKRYIREVYRTHRSDLGPDVQVVVVARPACAGLDYHACEASIRQLFQKGAANGG
ncbi:MAG TPA: ribonuclease P protein component [Candidatus Hydrogenedentes bacterium]|nr:ribonuclease P protein component [Candidatus Hydrogenedentota bacterium]HPG68035.1 ribonuclease P protein component [Candidatus Hydrogenedentota bacterium]